jgi:flagellar biosynthetic protein FliP
VDKRLLTVSARRLAFGALAALGIAALCAAGTAQAQVLTALTSTPAPGGGQTYALSLQILVLLTALTFLPAALLLMTSFTRIIIVLSLLRNALGLTSSPPNQVLIGLSLFLTMFIMGPTFDKVYQDAYLPFSQNKISQDDALLKAAAPMREFMFRQTRDPDLALFMKLGHQPAVKSRDEVPIRILVPAFVTSELKTAFQIGFIIFLPFIIIDLAVSSVLMSMGMMMLSPTTISLPFKLMLFVLADGWTLLIGSLVQSFIGV